MTNWWKSLKGKVRFEEPLSRHTTFKIGGPVKFLIEPADIKDLKLLIYFAKEYNLPIFLLGAGSNILVSDKGIAGIAVRLNSAYFKRTSRTNNMLEVGSGVMLGNLISFATKNSLSGVEFLSGIPGTVGGALAMNAGAWGRNMGDIIESVTLMDKNGNIKTLTKNNIRFHYRKSSLARYIILSCSIKLIKNNKEKIKEYIKKYLRFRQATQDNSFPNAGCIFKNPNLLEPAGKLIDSCSLKNKKVGGASVSGKHANFILNHSNAKCRDVLKLINLIESKVRQKFNIDLEPEIKIWK